MSQQGYESLVSINEHQFDNKDPRRRRKWTDPVQIKNQIRDSAQKTAPKSLPSTNQLSKSNDDILLPLFVQRNKSNGSTDTPVKKRSEGLDSSSSEYSLPRPKPMTAEGKKVQPKDCMNDGLFVRNRSEADLEKLHPDKTQMPLIQSKKTRSFKNPQENRPETVLKASDFMFLASLTEPPDYVIKLCDMFLEALQCERMCLIVGEADWASIQIELLHAEKLSYKSRQFNIFDCSPEQRNILQKMICISEVRAAAEMAKRQNHENSVSRMYFWCKYHCSAWREKWKTCGSHNPAEHRKSKPSENLQLRPSTAYSSDLVLDASNSPPLTASKLALQVPPLRCHTMSTQSSFHSSFLSARTDDSGSLITDTSFSTYDYDDDTSCDTPSTYYSSIRERRRSGSGMSEESSYRSFSSKNSMHFERILKAKSPKKPTVKLRALSALKKGITNDSRSQGQKTSSRKSSSSVNPQEFLAFPLEKNEIKLCERTLAQSRVHAEQALKVVQTPVFAFHHKKEPLLQQKLK